MVSRQEIQATCDDIVREFAPLQVILFGSYAYGTPTEDSDVDLLVVMPIPKSEFRNKAVEIRQRIPYRFSMDLLVRSPEEIAYRVSYNDWFLREVTEKGELLHGSNAHYNIEKQKEVPNPVIKEKGNMNPLTQEWIGKAEEDYNSAKWLQQSPNAVHNSICFHVQQCIEKYLKAWLQEANIPFLKTHDLQELLDLIVPTVSIWQTWKPDFKIISTYAVDSRYPGDSATAENTQHAMQICDEVRQAIRTQLELTE
ncbi:MAG: HEPN domain-containing protein [Candidatus Poribacteria bacterium]|nr:HEPN domain-containing protein [Candidatus Poribacteria bacterium]